MTAKYLLKHPVTSDMGYLVVANSCEEGLGNLYGTRQIFSDWGGRVKEYLSFDCYAGMIVNHAVGSHRFRISADVQGGHSYANFGRPNAIKVLADVLEDLCALEIPEHPKTTFNVGTFEGGVSVNAIAEHAEMLFEYRSAFDAVLARMDGELARVVEGHIRPGVHLMHEASRRIALLLGKSPTCRATRPMPTSRLHWEFQPIRLERLWAPVPIPARNGSIPKAWCRALRSCCRLPWDIVPEGYVIRLLRSRWACQVSECPWPYAVDILELAVEIAHVLVAHLFGYLLDGISGILYPEVRHAHPL